MTQWPDQWTDLDDRAVVTARALAADAVEKVGNGHPGTAMALAPAAYLLFQRFLRHDPNDPTWLGRDRFILSCGHTSLTLYIQLYLSGYPITLEDLKQFRTLGSLTPGHPEHNPARGIEMTTGPLGQGISSAVGIAMAQRYTRGLLDPDADPGSSPFDSTVWVLASDGDLRGGHLGARPAAWPGRRPWAISWSSGTTTASPSRATPRCRSPRTSPPATAATAGTPSASTWPRDGSVDVAALAAALDDRSLTRPTCPSMIQLRSIIALAGTERRRTPAPRTGPPWVRRRSRRSSEALGLDPGRDFDVDEKVLDHAREVMERGAALHAEWERRPPGVADRPARARGAAGPSGQRRAARGLDRRAAHLRARQQDGHTQGVREDDQRTGQGPARAVGRVRGPRRVQRHHDQRRGRVPPGPLAGARGATRTGAPCTSASGSTRWARSSTASGCTASRGPTAARSWSSATTCVRRSGWPR